MQVAVLDRLHRDPDRPGPPWPAWPSCSSRASRSSPRRPPTRRHLISQGKPPPPPRPRAPPSGFERGGRQHRHPAGPAPSPIRSGSRSTSAPATRISQVVLNWRPRTARRSRSRPPPTARPGRRSTPPPRHGRRADPDRVRDRRYVTHERHRPRDGRTDTRCSNSRSTAARTGTTPPVTGGARSARTCWSSTRRCPPRRSRASSTRSSASRRPTSSAPSATS